jgi:8-oxo-dGTP pyrophosphatase MutT (NUDIX family)
VAGYHRKVVPPPSPRRRGGRPGRRSGSGGSGGSTGGEAPAEGTGGGKGSGKGSDRARKSTAKKGSKQPDGRAGRRTLRKVEETSAGGLVVDRTGSHPRVALIGRRDRRGRLLWSLPKGHVENGETAEDAAVREVEEETGIRGVVVAPLGTIDYWFVAENRRIHKTVHHYLLEASGGELSDEDVEVDEVAWVPLDELTSHLAYAGERRLAETAADLLADSA